MIRETLRKRVVEAARGAGMGKKGIDVVLAEARECAYITNGVPRGANGGKVGGSRIGGMPDLPEGVEWPRGVDKRGRTTGWASFLMQVNLAEVPVLAGVELPRRGHLWLFVRGWEDGLTMAAVYGEEGRKLKRRAAPTESEWGHGAGSLVARAMPVRFKLGVSLPYFREAFIAALGATMKGGGGNAFDLVGKVLGEVQPRNEVGQVGGWSVVPEFDLPRWIAFRRMGREECRWADYWGTMAEYEKDRRAGRYAARSAKRERVKWIVDHRKEIAAEAGAWRLLVSLGGNMEADLDLGDGLALEVFVREDALARGDFGGVAGECPMVL